MSSDFGQFICIDDEHLRIYLKSFRKEDFSLGKEYELIAALFLKNWFRITYKVTCKIGLIINSKYSGKHIGVSSLSFEETKNLIELYKDEDGPIDFVICPIEAIHSRLPGKLSAKAWAFQVKRFGNFQEEKDTAGLKKFLAKIARKYSKTKLTLVIFFDGHRGISPQETNAYIKTLNFPFREVMFINASQNKEGVWKMHIGEFWPNWGYNEYEPTELAKYE